MSILPVSAVVVELDSRRILALNETYAARLGLAIDSVEGRTPEEIGFHAENDDRGEVLERTRDGNIHHTHRRTRFPDGSLAEYIDSSRRLLVDGRECLFSCYEPASRVVAEAVSFREAKDAKLGESEKKLHIVAEMSLDMLSRHDLDGICRWASPASRRILGIDPEAAVGRDAFDFIKPDDHAAVRSALSTLMETGQARLQYRIRRTDWVHLWVESVWSLSRDAAGNPSEIHCSTRDVSERREAERRIQELAVFNQTLLDTSGALIVVLDLAGTVVRFNRACQELTGWSESEVAGKPFFEIFIPAEHRDEVREVFRNLAAKNFPSRHENEWVTRSGQRRWVAWANSVVLGESGEIQYVVGTGLDRTEQRLAENEIVQLNESLERRVAERTSELQSAVGEMESFSYSISHDLRSPLRAIDGFSKALIEDAGEGLPADLRSYLDRIRRASQHMGHLIDDLLQLSRSSRAEIVHQDIDLSSLALQILEDLASQSEPRRSRLSVEPGISIVGDGVLVRSVLENLLGNAWKYSSFKPETVIELTSEVEDGRRWIVIQDNGVGLDMDHADKLFGTFQRLHPAGQFEGTGIGLATVRKIVERHGGRVSGSGVPGEGAVFRFTLDPSKGNS